MTSPLLRAFVLSVVSSVAACSGTNAETPGYGGAGDTTPAPGTDPSGNGTGTDAGSPPVTAGDAGLETGPRRLTIQGSELFDRGAKVRLRGANLEGIDDAGATEMADVLHMNFARLRISWEAPNRDDADPTGLTADYRASIDAWLEALAKKRIWTLLELRSDDATTNGADLYTTTSPTFAALAKTWTYLATRTKDRDFIAGYGLLAEPSPERTQKDYATALTTFQRTLMDRITSATGDTRTPFFVGAAYNYDALELWNDTYATGLAPYAGRLVHEVNFLVPKPWIDTGLSVDGTKLSFPQTSTASYDDLLTVAPGEKFAMPADGPRVYNKRTENAALWPLQLTSGFPTWYFGKALAFRTRHPAPMVADQFGASTNAGGQLAYEKSLVDFFEANGFGWCRWGYNAGSKQRRMVGNEAVKAFYADLGKAYPAP